MPITLYSKTHCPPCSNLKLWFKIKNIDYSEVDIKDHLQEMISLGFTSAPVVRIGNKYLAGSNISIVKEALEL